MEETKMTLKQAAQQALDCQDACNSCGLVLALGRIMRGPLSDIGGTDARNQHPITYLFLYKLMALAGHEPVSEGWEAYTEAERACNAIIAATEAVAA